MQALSVLNRLAAWGAGARSSIASAVGSGPSTRRDALVSRFAKHQGVLLLCVLAGCAVRAPRTDVMDPQAELPEASVKRLISVWEQQLARYVDKEGGGDPAVLSRTQVLHSRDIARPARITFGVLDVQSDVPGRDGWDLQGLLIGKQTSGMRNWYVFVVGIVARNGYRPSEIQDMRVVAFSTHAGKRAWQMSQAEPQAVQRYRDTYGVSGTVRFPGDTDRFSMNGAGERLSVQEVRSGATWALRLSALNSDSSRHAANAARSSSGRASAGWVGP